MLQTQVGPVAQSVYRLSYGLDGPGIESRWGARFSVPVQPDPGAHPTSCTICTGSFLGAKSVRGMTLTPHPPPVPSSRKSRTIPPLPLRAVRPVQSLSACTRVHFTLLFFCKRKGLRVKLLERDLLLFIYQNVIRKEMPHLQDFFEMRQTFKFSEN